MRTNQEYKNTALALLCGNWSPAVLVTIVYLLVTCISVVLNYAFPNMWYVVFISQLFMIFVVMPMDIAYYTAFQKMHSEGNYDMVQTMFSSFKEKYPRYLGGMFLTGLYILLWTLLLIIPGIIKAFAYAMTPFILNDYPELSPNQAIDLSCRMMKGHKFDLFWLGLSFIGWYILGFLTLGVAYLWLVPYMYTSVAAFYQDLKKEYINPNN